MNYSKETRSFAYSLVQAYAKYDHLAEQFVLQVEDLADFDLNKLTSLLMLDEPEMAKEATGPDNDKYKNHMLPALTLYLTDTTNLSNQLDFVEAWQEGITFYFMNEMECVLSVELEKYNQLEAA